MTDGRNLPWLQDPTGGGVTVAWEARYRDFVILDPANERPVDAYNLTDNTLSDPANRAALKSILLAQAILKDTDDDKLSDFWESEMFDGDLSPGQGSDRDSDTADELLEYALGSHADDASSMPVVDFGTVAIGEDRFPAIRFRQRLGAAAGLTYVVEFSRDLLTWSSTPEDIVEVGRVNPYDGTGTEVVIFRAAQSVDELPQGKAYLRVRAMLPES